MTNGETIRKNDETLAKWLVFHMDCKDCPIQEYCNTINAPISCSGLLKNWLKQEAKDE